MRAVVAVVRLFLIFLSYCGTQGQNLGLLYKAIDLEYDLEYNMYYDIDVIMSVSISDVRVLRAVTVYRTVYI